MLFHLINEFFQVERWIAFRYHDIGFNGHYLANECLLGEHIFNGLGMLMILCQTIDVMVQRIDPRSSKTSSLTHASAESFSDSSCFFDKICIS